MPVKPLSPPHHPETGASQEKTLSPERITDWPALAASLSITGFARQLATQSLLVSDDGFVLTLSVSIKNLSEQPNINKLAAALRANGFERKIHVQVNSVTDKSTQTLGKTAHQVDQDARASVKQTLEQNILQDPMVQQLIEEFDATIVPGSIEPIGDSK